MNPWPLVPLSELLTKSEQWINLDPETNYREITVRLWGKGVELRREVSGAEIASSRRLQVKTGQLILSRIDARNGALGLVPDSLDGAVVSNDFPVFTPDPNQIFPPFLGWMSKTRTFVDLCKAASEGTTNRVRLQEERFLSIKIPLPPLPEQRRIVARIETLAAKIYEARDLRQQATEESEGLVLRHSLRIFEALTSNRKPLGAVAEKRTGVAYKAQDFDDAVGVPVVRLKEIGTKTPTVFLQHPEAYTNVWLEVGDIVLAKTSFSTGTMCQWLRPPAVLNQNAIMLRTKAAVEQHYLFLWLRQQVYRYLRDHLADPNFYPYIREADLIEWLVPVPLLTEQRQIMAALDALQEHVDALKKLQAETAAELDALLPSILDRAFSGNL